MQEISVTELKTKLDNNENIQLIDVRETWELEICQLENAKNIPLTEITSRIDEVERDVETLVLCHHGGRSQQVAMWLEQQGFGEMTNVIGGIDAWAVEIEPDMARY